MLSDYLGVIALMVVAAAIAVVFVGGSWLLGPKKRSKYKQAAYECGVEPVGDVHERFPIKFYLVGILFIIFDIEVVFLWSWFSVYKTASPAFQRFTLVEFLSYMLTWVIGYIYVMRIGAIDWDEATSLPAKKGSQEEAA
ncbi:MAG TPA: NADH-quinone oxidoreductase subunit A [Fimbriimonadaceae bacterium]|nr:NADH-quinone oxidoreductase subunit A [Fimbriimonadaceae bacterium]